MAQTSKSHTNCEEIMRTPTGRRMSDPAIQNLKPPMTDEERGWVNAIKEALRREMGS